MKALLSTAPGGPETLAIGDLDTPVPSPGQVLVAVRACAVNFPDTLIIEDKYQVRPPRPFAPGGEISGVVESLGAGVTRFAVGDRVFGMSGHGGMAEKAVLPENQLFTLPAQHDFNAGAAMLFTYGTSIHALVDRGKLKAGETLLILGAAGGVGLAAIEIAKAMGARVIGAVSSPEKVQAARDAGADDVVIYGRAPFTKDESKALADQFKAAVGPKGADVIYDAVGGDYCEPALRSIAWEGRYLVVGFPAGIPRLPLNLTLLKSCDVCGVFWGAFIARDPAANAAHVAQLLAWWDSGKITPRITQVLPLARGGDGIASLANRTAIGKIVVEVHS